MTENSRVSLSRETRVGETRPERHAVFPKLGAMGSLSYDGRSSVGGVFQPPADDQLKLFGSRPGQRDSQAA